MANKEGPTFIYCTHANEDNHAHFQPGGMFVLLDWTNNINLGLCPTCAAIVRGAVLSDTLQEATRQAAENIAQRSLRKG